MLITSHVFRPRRGNGARAWHQKGSKDLTISANVLAASLRQLPDNGFSHQLLPALVLHTDPETNKRLMYKHRLLFLPRRCSWDK